MLISPGGGGEPVAVAGASGPPSSYKTLVSLAVVGRHLAGESHNHELVSRGGCFGETAATDDSYRLYLLPPRTAPLPALVRRGHGARIEIELWSLSAAAIGDLLVALPAPLGFGRITLADGRRVLGFLGEAAAVDEALLAGTARDITVHGGWRRRPIDPEEIQ